MRLSRTTELGPSLREPLIGRLCVAVASSYCCLARHPVTPRQGYGRRWLADIQHCLAQDHPIQGTESLLPNLPALCLDGIHFGAVAEIERRVVEFRSPSPDHWTEFM